MNKEVYKHILHTYGRNPGQWVGFFAEVIRVFIMRVYIVIIMAHITTSIASGDFTTAKHQTVYFLIAYIIASLSSTAGELLSLLTENQEYGRLMMVFYKKLIGKDLSFYRDNQTGYLSTAFRQYLDSAMLLIRFIRGEALGTFISLIAPPIVLFLASPKIGLVALAIIIVQFIYVTWASSKAQQYREQSHEVYRKITGEVSDVITNMVAFKAGGVEDQSLKNMGDLVEEETTAFKLRRKTTVLLDLPRNIITACGVSLAIYLIVSSTSALETKTIGLMVLTISYMFQIVRNVFVLPNLITRHDDLITKMYPTLKYLSNEYESVRDPETPSDLVITHGAIHINNISFSYPSHSQKGSRIPVFKNLSIEINGGEQVGIVGLSGAGKSTLASLLLRFDDVEHGAITIDGIDIRDVHQSDLRKNIAYVPQEPLLFHRSIKENISYYNGIVSEDDIIEAAKAAYASEFIEKLPEGYNTIVGERGIKLSGGQKQRVAIARAILKKAPIMIFDEATSALDSESEQIIQRALPEIIGKQTAIVVAHRLSTVAGLHRIIVMHEGKVIESGTHEELLEHKGRYYSLWQKQTSEFASV